MDVLILSMIIVVIILLYYYAIQKQRYWEKRGIPMIKSNVPFFGNMWKVVTFQKNINTLYEDFYNAMPNFSMIGLYSFGGPELFIRDPDLVKCIVQTNHSNFHKPGMSIDHEKNPLLRTNPFFSVGEEWKKARSVLTNTMSTAKLRNMVLGVNEVCVKFHDYLEQNIKLNDGTYEAKIEDISVRFTCEVVSKAGFGIDGNCFTNVKGSFLDVAKAVFDPTGLVSFKHTLIMLFPSLALIFDSRLIPIKIDRYLRNVVKEVLEVRKQLGVRGNDFIQQIIDTYKPQSGVVYETFITGYAVSFLMDGYLTSSYTLGYIVYEIATHSEVQEKLRKEVKEVLQKHEHKVTYESLQDLKYMDMVIQESMRLVPVGSILSRVCTEEFQLVGNDGLKCVVRVGDRVTFCPGGLQKDPKYWEHPETFDPERFREGSKTELNKFIYLPFGGGPRVCVGMRMALLQMKAALATLLDHYSFELSSKTKIPFTYEKSLFKIVSGGMWINVKPL